MISPNTRPRGYTLIELIIAVGIFALVMTLAGGAYLIVIGVNRQVHAMTTGINNLSYALDTMARNIRTGTGYRCGSGNCTDGPSFSFTDQSGRSVTYSLSNNAIQQNVDSVSSTVTDPAITISALRFYASGTGRTANSDYTQPYVTIVISGEISTGRGDPLGFSLETSAAMRGTDI
ncbi:prepilin-type N-terminal cleavage/methylation domain-containing protein [Candidatus Kaiserbacteria bacterium]|nr:prepilin-type N-terminal cleavage/methylation domain-containing protein [Candidatus Kaiserbacteria bacterium]